MHQDIPETHVDVFPLVVATNQVDINIKVSETIAEISKYRNSNKLALNISQTQVMLINKKRKQKYILLSTLPKNKSEIQII